MSDEIKSGDLVMVVRGLPCCGFMGLAHFGLTFIVTAVFPAPPGLSCKCCNAPASAAAPCVGANISGEADAMLMSMVKKIDPPAEGDSLPTRRDLEMPA